MRNFRELEIWKKGMAIAKKIYTLTSDFPIEEQYGLVNQMRRCAVSIPSNIAEGCGRGDKELRHFLRIAMGSSFELESQVILANDLGFMGEIETLVDEIKFLQKQINDFRLKIPTNP